MPINIFGGQRPGDAALAYITPKNGPYQHSVQKQDVASINFSGEPIQGWAGPISLAVGGEWRKEQYHVQGDPYGDGNTDSPNTADYPADPILNASGANWFAGNYHSGAGKYSVKEAYAEVNVPLVNSDAAGKANLNMAGRWTDYSTSGTIYTWKIGATWDTPIDGVRLRAVTSRDVRAPNLSELFAAPVTTTLPNFTVPSNGQPPAGQPASGSLTVLQNVVGGTEPEAGNRQERHHRRGALEPAMCCRASAFAVGLLVQHRPLTAASPGPGRSADRQLLLCGPDPVPAAPSISTPPSAFVNSQTFNLRLDQDQKRLRHRGAAVSPSNCPAFGPASRSAPRPRTCTSSSPIRASRGRSLSTRPARTQATPDWKVLAIQSWDTDRFALSVQERWFSDGRFGGTTTGHMSSASPAAAPSRPAVGRPSTTIT
ncbi:TonB-dependent receptor [Caulobacter segnis]